MIRDIIIKVVLLCQNKIKVLIASTGKNQATLAREMGITPMSLNYKVKKCKSLKLLLELATACDFEVVLRKRDGSIEYEVTKEDLEEN